jgi:hypothetical protein
MPRTRTTFQLGHAGMGGRPKDSKDRFPRGSLKAAWLAVTRAEPHLLEDAIRAGLAATRPSDRLGFLELGTKLSPKARCSCAGGVSERWQRDPAAEWRVLRSPCAACADLAAALERDEETARKAASGQEERG